LNKTSELLFDYLKNIFYGSKDAQLNLEELDEDFVNVGKALVYFTHCYSECRTFASSIAAGDLEAALPGEKNEMASSLKSLHAGLKHLTWQAQQVAKGDYSQRVDFMGAFSDAFNTMIAQLAERQNRLEKEIETINRKSKALEGINKLLTNITKNIPQQIFVLARGTVEILYMNEMARDEIINDNEYLIKIKNKMEDSIHGKNTVLCLTLENEERYMSISPYLIEWDGINAEAFVINDVSADMNRFKKLNAQKQELREMVNIKTRTVVELQNAILKVMAELVESRDYITGGHIERTQNYLQILIDAMQNAGLYKEETSDWDFELVLHSAQLHDVGKITIDDAILRKPGSLTEEEYEKIKIHTIFGEEIIERIKLSTSEHTFLEHARILALTHHERWNGSGYPKGLKGTAIPLQGRLMAIADVYDALVSVRPYKYALTHEEAVEIITKNSGSHYDPELIAIFLSVADKFNEVNVKYITNNLEWGI